MPPGPGLDMEIFSQFPHERIDQVFTPRGIQAAHLAKVPGEVSLLHKVGHRGLGQHRARACQDGV